jgi:hypothetical protein
MMALSKTTRDHDEIRRWAESHGAVPSEVASTHSGKEPGILRFQFPETAQKNDDNLQEVSWDDFFAKFDENNLELLYQEQTADGEKSNFNKLIHPENDKTGRGGSAKAKRTTKSGGRSAAAKNGSRAAGKSAAKSSSKASGGSSGRSAKKSSANRTAKKASTKKSSSSRAGRSSAKAKSTGSGRVAGKSTKNSAAKRASGKAAAKGAKSSGRATKSTVKGSSKKRRSA